MPSWVEQGYQEYAKRMLGDCQLILDEIPAGKRSKNASTAKIVEEEGVRLLKSLPKQSHIVTLDVKGWPWSTEQLAKNMGQWMQDGKDISLLVGGPEGLSKDCQNAAHQSWSLSALTFPHPLVRVILAEQLYRAYSILKNHPYHRAG